jgi:hypothetical protein
MPVEYPIKCRVANANADADWPTRIRDAISCLQVGSFEIFACNHSFDRFNKSASPGNVRQIDFRFDHQGHRATQLLRGEIVPLVGGDTGQTPQINIW